MRASAALETVRERRADPRARADFLPVILSGGGYDVKTSLLLSAPPYVVAGFFTAMMAFLSDKFRKRALFIGISSTVCFTGLFIMAYADKLGIRYVRPPSSPTGSAGGTAGLGGTTSG